MVSEASTTVSTMVTSDRPASDRQSHTLDTAASRSTSVTGAALPGPTEPAEDRDRGAPVDGHGMEGGGWSRARCKEIHSSSHDDEQHGLART